MERKSISTLTVNYRTAQTQSANLGDSFEAVYIGADAGCNAGKGRCHWSGIIDEIVMFNVPLSADDVKSLGNGIEGVLAVDAAGKTTTTWGKLKAAK